MDNKGFTFRKRWAGFKYAFRGIRLLLRYEHSAWLHSLIAVCTVAAGFLLQISVTEWIIIVIACGCVFAAEALNTAIEKLADIISPEYNEAIRNVKDLSAGGVLLMAIAAAIVGCLIFLPKLIMLF